MMRFYILIGILLILVSVAASTQDAGRCDCAPENLGGSCVASVSLKGQWITVTSNVPECSRVDWYTDEQPQLTLVKNYKEVEEWLGRDKQPKLSVQSCRICNVDGGAGNNAEYSRGTDAQPVRYDLSGTWNCRGSVIFDWGNINYSNTPTCTTSDRTNYACSGSDTSNIRISEGKSETVTSLFQSRAVVNGNEIKWWATSVEANSELTESIYTDTYTIYRFIDSNHIEIVSSHGNPTLISSVESCTK